MRELVLARQEVEALAGNQEATGHSSFPPIPGPLFGCVGGQWYSYVYVCFVFFQGGLFEVEANSREATFERDRAPLD